MGFTQLRPHLIVSAEYKVFTFSSTFFFKCSATSIFQEPHNSFFSLHFLVPPTRVELITYALEVRCSIQLSYGGKYVGKRATWFIFQPNLLGMSCCVCSSIATLCELNSYDGVHIKRSLTPSSLLYRWADSNRHEHYYSRDFKSLVSTISPHRHLTTIISMNSDCFPNQLFKDTK